MRFIGLALFFAFLAWALKGIIRDAITEAAKVSDRELERAVRRDQEWSKEEKPNYLAASYFVLAIIIVALLWGR